MTPNYALGTVATYYCNTGYVLDLAVGSEMRTCVDDDGMDATGIFDHQAPTCIRKSAYKGQSVFIVLVGH